MASTLIAGDLGMATRLSHTNDVVSDSNDADIGTVVASALSAGDLGIATRLSHTNDVVSDNDVSRL